MAVRGEAEAGRGDPPARRSPAPLGLLHPTGHPAEVRRLGTADAGGLGGHAGSPGSEPIDVLLLAPTPSEHRSSEWLELASQLASRLEPDGLVVVVGGARRLRARLRGLGLRRDADLLHVPNVAVSRYVLPRGGAVGRYAISRLLPLSPAKRIAGRALALTRVAFRGRTSTVYRRPGARPMLSWLADAVPSAAVGDRLPAVVGSSWRRGGSTVIHTFSAGVPEGVVKLGAAAPGEARALTSVAAGARTDAVAVPVVVREGELSGVPLLVETPIAGTLAWSELRGKPRLAAELLDLIARWLSAWNATTMTARSFGPEEAERWLLGRARSLAPLWTGGPRYLAWLERACESCAGASLPLVAAHNDLTAANIVLTGSETIGIVDWERAEPAASPLADLAYAAVDFTAAVSGYRDRPAAYSSCFLDGGREAEQTRRLLREATAALALSQPLAEVCLHSCWLRHAANEAEHLAGEPEAERPFLRILEVAAREVSA